MYYYEIKFLIIFLFNREDLGVFFCIFLVFLCLVGFFKVYFYKYIVIYYFFRNLYEFF